MARVVGGVLGLVGVFAAVFLVLFLGGLCSAWFEIRAEKKAGVPVTRPAWDRARARREAGGRFAYLRGLFHGLRAPVERAPKGGCDVCGSPMIASMDSPDWVCVADLNGDPRAERLHDAWEGVSWEVRHAS